VTGGLNDHIGTGLDRFLLQFRGNSSLRQDIQLISMVAHDGQVAAGERHHLRTQQPQLAVAQYDDAVSGADVYLLENLTGGGQRLGEDGDFIGDGIRHGVEVADGQRQILGKGPVAASDAQRSAVGAVGGTSGQAGRAIAAGDVDLAHHAVTLPFFCARRSFYYPDEFVAGDALELHVPLHQFQVSVADSGHIHADECLPRRCGGGGIVLD